LGAFATPSVLSFDSPERDGSCSIVSQSEGPPGDDCAATFRLTVTICGVPCAGAAAVTVMWPVYAPGASPVWSAEIVTVAGALPLVGAAVSQGASDAVL
jgi:hypothetical protein